MPVRNIWRALCACIGLWAATASGQLPALPGGATSLREVHGDWVVNCVITGQNDQARKACAMSQEQRDNRTNQRVIAIELQPAQDTGTLMLFLPFGLDLSYGAIMQVDDEAKGAAQPFRTCVPAGCIVAATADGKMLASMRRGTALKVSTKADGGRETTFSLSLNGFASAFDRTVALAK